MLNEARVEVLDIYYPPEQGAGHLPTPRILKLKVNEYGKNAVVDCKL
jgi:hypothetical protein